MGALVGALALAAVPLRAEQGAVVVEGGGARALPPSGVVGDAATYAVGGLRVEWSSARGALLGAAYGGRATDEAGSDFVSGAVGGELWLNPGAAVGVGLGAAVQAFTVEEPLYYRLTAAEISPMVRIGGAAGPVLVRGRFGRGSSCVELRRADGTVRRADHELWTRGADVELRLAATHVAVTAVSGLHRARNGDYRRGGLRLVATPGSVTLTANAELWSTPGGRETVGGVSIAVPVGRLETRASLARTASDPLTRVEPGVQSGVVVGLRLGSFGGSSAKSAVHEVVATGARPRVRVRVAPPRATTVELLGDFADWTPVALARDGTGWSVELEMEPGTYHFGFLVDGEWWLPEGLQGTVPDDWGRSNATMVVPEEAR